MLREFSINPGGWIPKRFIKNKGYTLIEVVSVIAISIIVMSIGFTLLISTYKYYSNSIEDAVREDEVDNALINIDRLITRDMITEINVRDIDKEIEVVYSKIYGSDTLLNTKVIKYENGKLVVKTYDGLRRSFLLATNTILKDVREFNIIKKENIYYYKIILKTGDEIIQCI